MKLFVAAKISSKFVDTGLRYPADKQKNPKTSLNLVEVTRRALDGTCTFNNGSAFHKLVGQLTPGKLLCVLSIRVPCQN